MEHQAELDNAKPQPDGVDAPPIALLNTNHTEERQVTFNIGEEIRYTKDGNNENAHILTVLPLMKERSIICVLK